jgi:hypothetical protein
MKLISFGKADHLRAAEDEAPTTVLATTTVLAPTTVPPAAPEEVSAATFGIQPVPVEAVPPADVQAELAAPAVPGAPAAPATAAEPTAAPAAPGVPPAPSKDGELAAQRDRLIERFAIMQCELGGLFYEMAIRDHVRMDVLIERAAALQRLDAELGQIERMLETGASAAGGTCPSCGSIYARGAAFCAQCAHPLAGA